MNRISKGIWPTMITPFTTDNKIDYTALAAMIDWYAENGCDGVFAVCQSSEMFYLSLEERVELAKACVSLAGDRLEVIASGHISDDFEEQCREIEAIWATGIRAFVLVTNRLAKEDESDEVWIANAQKLVERFPDITFGLYECPYPYKRLLTDKTLTYVAQSGRFAFLKDTCCDAHTIADRLELIARVTPEGVTPLGLYNANTMTLLESLQCGADGFCGVMGNMHPDLYAWLYANYKSQPERAAALQASLALLSSLEAQAYPVCAKAHMQDDGIPITTVTRTIPASRFGYMQAETLRQAREMEKALRNAYLPQKGELTDFVGALNKELTATVHALDESVLLPAAQLIWEAQAQGKRLHITGIGKPSYVAGYISSLISSTGSPMYFLHGTEAVHGSCGQIECGDVVICISNSGETAELKATAIAARNNGAKIIAVTGNANSWLATFAEVHLPAHVDIEGGPLNRAPRTSILAETIVLQALSVLLQKKRNITPAEYVLRHPGGSLGQLRDNEK